MTPKLDGSIRSYSRGGKVRQIRGRASQGSPAFGARLSGKPEWLGATAARANRDPSRVRGTRVSLLSAPAPGRPGAVVQEDWQPALSPPCPAKTGRAAGSANRFGQTGAR